MNNNPSTEPINASYIAELEFKAKSSGSFKPNKTTCKAVRKLAFLGLSDKEICDFLGVSPYTFGFWKRDEKFKKALANGRVYCVANVAHAMYKRAVGWSHEDVHIVVVKGEVIKVPITKHYAPDVAAAQFILKNKTRMLENPWADVNRTEHTGVGGGPIQFALDSIDTKDMSLEELLILQKLIPQTSQRELSEAVYDDFEMVVDRIMNEEELPNEPPKEKTTKFQRTK